MLKYSLKYFAFAVGRWNAIIVLYFRSFPMDASSLYAFTAASHTIPVSELRARALHQQKTPRARNRVDGGTEGAADG